METVNQPPKIKPVNNSIVRLILSTLYLTKAKNMLVLLIMVFRVIIHISTGEGNILDLMLELAWAMIIGNILFIITGMFSSKAEIDMEGRAGFVGLSGFGLIVMFALRDKMEEGNLLIENLLMIAITLSAIWYIVICAKEMDLVTYLMGPEPEKETTDLNQENNNSLNV